MKHQERNKEKIRKIMQDYRKVTREQRLRKHYGKQRVHQIQREAEQYMKHTEIWRHIHGAYRERV